MGLLVVTSNQEDKNASNINGSGSSGAEKHTPSSAPASGAAKEESNFFSDNKITLIGLAIAAFSAVGGAGILSLVVLAAAFFLGGANDKAGFLSKTFPNAFNETKATQPLPPSVTTVEVEKSAIKGTHIDERSNSANSDKDDTYLNLIKIYVDKNGKLINENKKEPDALFLEIEPASGKVSGYTVFDEKHEKYYGRFGESLTSIPYNFILPIKSVKKENMTDYYLDFESAEVQEKFAKLRSNWDGNSAAWGEGGGKQIHQDANDLPKVILQEAPSVSQSRKASIIDVRSDPVFIVDADGNKMDGAEAGAIKIRINPQTGAVLTVSTADENAKFPKDAVIASEGIKFMLRDGKIDASEEANKAAFARIRNTIRYKIQKGSIDTSEYNVSSGDLGSYAPDIARGASANYDGQIIKSI